MLSKVKRDGREGNYELRAIKTADPELVKGGSVACSIMVKMVAVDDEIREKVLVLSDGNVVRPHLVPPATGSLDDSPDLLRYVGVPDVYKRADGEREP